MAKRKGFKGISLTRLSMEREAYMTSHRSERRKQGRKYTPPSNNPSYGKRRKRRKKSFLEKLFGF